MCQCQLSSLTLPSDAAMPPCAATVCERVGNTLDSTATLSPASDSCSAARIPAPPAPTMTASNFLLAIVTSAPQNICRPYGIKQQRQNNQYLQHQAGASGVHIIHQNVAHPDPGMPA